MDTVLSRFPESSLDLFWVVPPNSDVPALIPAATLEAQRSVQLPFDLFFLDAPGGSGKTLLLRFLAAHLRSQGLVVICAATTGIAALNFDGGLTAHSMFKLPLDLTGNSVVSNLSMMSERAELLRSGRLWILDEVSMAHSNMFTCIVRLIRDLKPPKRPVIVTSGDFRQCPPVIKWGTKTEVLRAAVKFNTFFETAHILRLTQNIRAQEDREYSAMVAKVGNGTAPEVLLPDYDIPLTPLPLIRPVENLEKLIEFVYPKDQDVYISIKRAILSGTNAKIDHINAIILERLPGKQFTLLSADRCEDGSHHNLDVPPDVVAQCNDVGVPQHALHLKPGAIAMITRNLSFGIPLCNSMKVLEYFWRFPY